MLSYIVCFRAKECFVKFIVILALCEMYESKQYSIRVRCNTGLFVKNRAVVQALTRISKRNSNQLENDVTHTTFFVSFSMTCLVMNFRRMFIYLHFLFIFHWIYKILFENSVANSNVKKTYCQLKPECANISDYMKTIKTNQNTPIQVHFLCERIKRK